jgi:Leucine-rich repeat (LRR) protein
MKNLFFSFLLFTFLINYAQSTYIPDTNFEIELANLGYDDGSLNHSVPTANISGVTYLYIPSKGISDLTGIEDFTSLTFLNCASNNLTTLDISNNLLLNNLICTGNNLTSLDVSNNTALILLSVINNNLASLNLSTNLLLESLYASNNLLTSLDLSLQPSLAELVCDNNLLTSLTVKNGNNSAIPNADFSVINNPNLLCIEVDNATYSTTNWTNIDAQTTFRNNCALTYVPDNNFEQELINLGYDTVLDDYVFTEDIEQIYNLNIASKGISDLTGITDFSQLRYLYVNNNLLTSLDVSQNSFLIYLNCSNNQITSLNLGSASGLGLVNCNTNLLNSLDVSNLFGLQNLNCSNNNLTNLNINNNTLLKYLYCGDNQLTNLNINSNSQLIYLSCVNNQISNLDISNNLLLTNLSCRNNQLTTLDTSVNVALSELVCGYNQITSLDLSTNIALTSLFCQNNQLTDLNIKNGNNTLITNSNYNTVNNSNLYCIQVDNSTYSNNNWFQSDTYSIFRNSCAKTYVPDDNFEQALIDDGLDNNPILDDYIYTDVANMTTGLYLSSKNISDLTGLEDFTSLVLLNLNDNNLTSIDLSVLSNLLYLYLNNNLLTDLDLSTNTSLFQLTCTGNQLTELDLNNNNLLNILHCDQNQLTELDLSSNSQLGVLLCDQNQLTRLNFKNGNNSLVLNSNFKANANPNLLCIEVDDVTYSNTTWTNIDATASFSTNCHYDETYVPDNNFEQELINLGYDTVLDDYVLTDNINTITAINLSAKGIADLTGIEDFIALETLLCVGNSLTSIDISNNINLLSLNCQSNNITTINTSANLFLDTLNCSSNTITNLDFTQNTFLADLDCSNNVLTNLNVSNNTNLSNLDCSNNQIGGLNLTTNTNLAGLDCSHNLLIGLLLTNGNNTAITDATFDATFNASLTCIEVDDEIYSTSNWTNIDYHASFANNCHYGETYVPDDNFEQELINLGYDTILDDYVITANINTVGFLDVSFKSIADLTGIGDFTVLTQLLCNNNMLINLDLGNNTLLNYVNCSFNNLSDVYISSPSLNYLSASNNQLLDIDLSGKLFLTYVELQNNSLNSLNIKNGNNTIITNFNITTNPNLFCVQVDDIAYSTTNWINKDAHTFYNTNCNYPSIWRTGHWINGIPTLTKNAIIDDDYNTGAFGSIDASQLNINSGKNVTISPNSYIRIDTHITNNGDFVIEHEGSFLQLQDIGLVSGTGNYLVKSKTTQLIDADRFTYFSSPTASETLNTFSSWANMNNVYSFNATLQAWNPELPSNMMLQAKGYAIKGQPDVGQYPFNGETNFNGYFNNGIYTVPLHFTPGDPLLDDDNALIGNPYPSAVSASLLLNNNANANAFYFWTHTSLLGSGGYIADDYAIWNRSGGIASTSGSPAPTGYIASCQGFFVTALGSGTFTFDNSVRVSANNNDFRRLANGQDDKIWLNLTNDDGYFNQILLNFSTEGTVNFDAKLDATRFETGNAISFYSNGLNQERFAIQALPSLLNQEVIPLGYEINNETINSMEISIDHFENFNEVDIYLKDNLLNITHDLTQSNYQFNVNNGIFNTRFELLLNRSSLGYEDYNNNNEKIVIINQEDSSIKVSTQNQSTIIEFIAYDILGKQIISIKPNLSSFIIKNNYSSQNKDVNIKQGTVLFIKAKLENGQILNTKFIKN